MAHDTRQTDVLTAPAVTDEDRDLARQARLWGRYLLDLAQVLEAGEGERRIVLDGKETSISLRRRTREIVQAAESTDSEKMLKRQRAARRTVQIKRALQNLYRHARRVYNGEPVVLPAEVGERVPTPAPKSKEARQRATTFFETRMPWAFPFPVDTTIHKATLAGLKQVLDGRASPLKAAYRPVQLAVKKYIRREITEDFYRQGAAKVLPVAVPPKNDPRKSLRTDPFLGAHPPAWGHDTRHETD